MINVYEEIIKRELKSILLFEWRCNERLKAKAEGSTRLAYNKIHMIKRWYWNILHSYSKMFSLVANLFGLHRFYSGFYPNFVNVTPTALLRAGRAWKWYWGRQTAASLPPLLLSQARNNQEFPSANCQNWKAWEATELLQHSTHIHGKIPPSEGPARERESHQHPSTHIYMTDG